MNLAWWILNFHRILVSYKCTELHRRATWNSRQLGMSHIVCWVGSLCQLKLNAKNKGGWCPAPPPPPIPKQTIQLFEYESKTKKRKLNEPWRRPTKSQNPPTETAMASTWIASASHETLYFGCAVACAQSLRDSIWSRRNGYVTIAIHWGLYGGWLGIVW